MRSPRPWAMQRVGRTSSPPQVRERHCGRPSRNRSRSSIRLGCSCTVRDRACRPRPRMAEPTKPGMAAPTPVPTMAEASRYLMRVVTLMRPFWRLLAKGMVMGLGLGFVGMINPYLAKLFFDRVYPTHDVSLLQVLVIGVLVLAVTNTLLNAVKAFYSATVSTQLNRAMSLMFFNHLQHLTVRFFDEHRVGEMTSRFGDVRTSLDTVSRVFETLVLSGTFLIFVPPLLLYLNPKLALLSLITVPLTTAVSTITSRWVRKYSKQSMEAGAELSAFQVEALSQIRTLKGMAAEHFVFRSANDQIQRSLRLQLNVATVSGVSGSFTALLRACGQAVFSWYAWSMIIRQQMTLGDFVAFTAYLGYLTGPVGQFAALFVSFQQSAVSFGRMFEYLDLPVEQDPILAY